MGKWGKGALLPRQLPEVPGKGWLLQGAGLVLSWKLLCCSGGRRPGSPPSPGAWGAEASLDNVDERVAAYWERKFQKILCSPLDLSVPSPPPPHPVLALNQPGELAGTSFHPVALDPVSPPCGPSLSMMPITAGSSYPRVAMTTSQAFGLHDNKLSKLFLFIYWEFQRIFHSLARTWHLGDRGGTITLLLA